MPGAKQKAAPTKATKKSPKAKKGGEYRITSEKNQMPQDKYPMVTINSAEVPMGYRVPAGDKKRGPLANPSIPFNSMDPYAQYKKKSWWSRLFSSA